MNTKIRRLIEASMCLAVGLVLPFITGQIPAIAKVISPMHIPVLICGLTVGWPYGLVIGLVTPLLRSLLFGMPALFPNAVSMAFELAAYGLVSGLVCAAFPEKNLKSVYISLVAAMLAGRVVMGLVNAVLYRFLGTPYGFREFFAAGFVNALPGIIIHLLLIPPIVLAIEKARK
jgi:thiamine transporter ThiT